MPHPVRPSERTCQSHGEEKPSQEKLYEPETSRKYKTCLACRLGHGGFGHCHLPGACCPLPCGELCLYFALYFGFLRFLSGSSKGSSEMSKRRASQQAHTERLLLLFLGSLGFPSLMAASKEVQSKSINRKKIIYWTKKCHSNTVGSYIT